MSSGPWPAAGATDAVVAAPRVPSAVPRLRPSWRPLAIAALALAAGGAGALIYARVSREPRRADGPQAAATAPSAAVVEPPPGAPPASMKPATPAAAAPAAVAAAPTAPAPATGSAATGSRAPGSATGSPAANGGSPAAGPRATGTQSSTPPPRPNAGSPNQASDIALARSDKRIAIAPRPPAAAARPSGPPGFITIDSSPVYASVYIDGKSYGETPLVRLELSPGRHVVHAVSPSGATRDVRISIEPGKVALAARIQW